MKINKDFCKSIDDVLELFEDSLSTSEILTAKLMAQISTGITKERIKLHMTQKEFADHIGVSQSEVSRWERGDYNFSIKKIAEIASKLSLEVNICMTDSSAGIGYSSYSSSFSAGKIINYSQAAYSKTSSKEDKYYVAVH